VAGVRRDAVLSGEIWRLWTGHLVHYSARHALSDTAVLILIGSLAEREFGTRWMCNALFRGGLFISLGLILGVPNLLEYRGASGLSLLLALATGTFLWGTRPSLRRALAVPGGVLLLKTALEACGIGLDLSGLPEDVAVAWQAHVLGAVGGAMLGTWALRPATSRSRIYLERQG